jgi:hypothetical protein
MRKIYILFLTGILIISVPAFGQKTVVVVEPDAGLEIGALNKAIKAVEAAGTGDNTIFELKRDGLYLLNGTISHTGYTLHIRGQEGTGSKPVLQPAVDELGASGRQFEPSANLTLERVYLQGRDELGAINVQPIRVVSDDCRIIIDDCVLDYAAQSLVRTSSSGNTIKITNSVLRNSLLPDNPSNGRIIDSRGNPNDTLWISNSTIYNNGATQLRSDGGATAFANFDHNTVYQTSFAHNMALDYIFKANITNNIFYNFLYRGDNTAHSAFFACDSIFGSDIDEYTDAGRYFDLSNNNWYVQPEIGEILDEYGPDTLYRFNAWDTEHTDTIWYRQTLRKNWFASDSLMALDEPGAIPDIVKFIQNGQVDTTGLFREELTFKNPPPLNLEYWKFYTENGWSITGMNPPNAYGDEDPNVVGEVQTGAFDFSYNASSRSATAAKGGLPLGASKWVPFTPVSANDIKLNNNNSVSTYPNPFDKQITFNIDSKEASKIEIRVYNLLGKELQVVQEKVNRGNNQLLVKLDKISNTGIYLYKIQFETENGIKSMSVGKIIKN